MIKKNWKVLKKNIWIILPLILLPYFIETLHFFFSGSINNLFAKASKIPVKLTSIFSDYKDYYAAVFSILATVSIFFIEQQDKEEKRFKEIRDQRSEDLKIKERELENYRNSFRPTFLVSSKEIKVIMQNQNYFIKDVYININNKIKFEQNEYLKIMRDGQSFKINCEGEIFITGVTMIGEKFIYGNILSGFEIYKVLREGGISILPSNFNNNYSVKDIINKNWVSYNNYNNSEKTDLDEIFMYKSVDLREKMSLNILEHAKNLLNSDNVKDLFNLTLSSISSNKNEFNDEVRKNIIRELLDILNENLSEITINISDLNNEDIDYINKKIKFDEIYEKENENPALYYVVKKYINFEKFSIDNIISVFLKLSEKSVYNDEFLNNNLVQYKTRIIDHIE